MTLPLQMPPPPPLPPQGLIQRILTTFQGWFSPQRRSDPGGQAGKNTAEPPAPPGAISTNGTATGSAVESAAYHEVNLVQLRYDREAIGDDVRHLVDSDGRIATSNQDIGRDVFGSAGLRVQVKAAEGTSESLVAQAQDVIDALFGDTDINGTGPGMVSGLLEDGELYLSPVLLDGRIYRLQPLPTLTMDPNVDSRGQFPDPMRAFRQIDLQLRTEEAWFALWQVNWIRWDYRPTRGATHGRSQYLQSRGLGRFLQMSENDMVVRRRSRATLPRHHQIGNDQYTLGTGEDEDYRVKNCPDPSTGQTVTDYVTSGKIKITTVEGGDVNLGHIDDVKHLQNAYMGRLGKPKSLMGWGEDINRDILEVQQDEYQEFLKGVRHLLWHGDGGLYSGLKAVCDFALALAGINPALVTYQPAWPLKLTKAQIAFTESIDKLRVSGLISHRTALEMVANTLGLESAEAELLLLKEERKAREDASAAADRTFAAGQTGAGQDKPGGGGMKAAPGGGLDTGEVVE
jgi:hypothetical protein